MARKSSFNYKKLIEQLKRLQNQVPNQANEVAEILVPKQ